MYQRIRNYLRATDVVLQAGGTFPSVLLYPLRRRSPRDPRGEVRFRNGCSLAAPSDFPLLNIIEEVWIRQCYRAEHLKFKSGATIIDIGANIGAFSVLLAFANPQARVIAVEPSRDNLKFLYRNIAFNGLSNVFVVSAACGGKRGEGILYKRRVANIEGLQEGYSDGSLHSLFCRDLFGSEFSPHQTTDIVALEDIFLQYDIAVCDLLKLDCEGAEFDILLNASSDVLVRIARIAMEYHLGFNDHSIQALECFLSNCGFQVDRLPMGKDNTGYLYASRAK